MRIARLALALAAVSIALALPALALAHAELVSTSPDDGENLDSPPTEVVMTFESEIDPDGSEFTVTDSSGAEVGNGSVDLQVAERNEMRGDVEITEAGVYTVSWTSVAEDGDEATGEFTFGYNADRAGEAPNTAVSSTGSPTVVVMGIGLIVMAAFGVGRRAAGSASRHR